MRLALRAHITELPACPCDRTNMAGVWSCEFFDSSSSGNDKAAAVQAWRDACPGTRLVFVGDGVSDLPVANVARAGGFGAGGRSLVDALFAKRGRYLRSSHRSSTYTALPTLHLDPPGHARLDHIYEQQLLRLPDALSTHNVIRPTYIRTAAS